MIHDITFHLNYNPHTVAGAWTIVGTVVCIVIIVLASLRTLTPVDAEPFNDHELERLLASTEEALMGTSNGNTADA